MLAFGLLSDETIESYQWLFHNLRCIWKRDSLNIIFDECQSIQQGKQNYLEINFVGLKNNFESRLLLCSWHLQRNIVSHFSNLGKKNKVLFDRVIGLPFITCDQKFYDVIKAVEESEDISDKELEYLNEKLKTKNQWAKCFTKENFCGGICTTSRIEGLHGVLK